MRRDAPRAARFTTHATAEPSLQSVRVVFENEHVWAVDKPAGMLSQPDASQALSLTDFARDRLGADQARIVHRLDRNVSGLVLIAKTQSAAAHLHAQLKSGELRRVYRAMVIAKRNIAGALPRHFEVTLALTKDADTNHVEVDDNGTPAHTIFDVDAQAHALAGVALSLRATLVTGRSHQIRVHLQSRQLLLAGDTKYGVALVGLSRPLLHAEFISFSSQPGGPTHQIHCAAPFLLSDILTLRARVRLP